MGNLIKKFASDHSLSNKMMEGSNEAVWPSELEQQQMSVEEDQEKTKKQALLCDISTAVDSSCASIGSKRDGAEKAVWTSEVEQHLIACDQTTNFETVIGQLQGSNECK